jgi:predicted AAA+ superfamily ATPase
LIFHIEAYGTSSKRTKKSWKYYFATSSLKHAITSTLGSNSIRKEEYEGLLLENMIASLSHEKSTKIYNTYLFYDSNKNNVDFIIQRGLQNPIPIEVERGKKDKKQIIQAMKTYKSSRGIIISNSRTKICKEDNIIYIPYKTFSLL